MLARSRVALSIGRSLLLLLLLSMSVAPPASAQVAVDMTNPHYLDYNGDHVLIGMSSEYLPHVTRPPKQGNLCTWDTYASCLSNLHTHGLNTMQLFLSLNSSIGLQDCNASNLLNPVPNPTPVAVPYDYEQPFFWNGSKWRLDRYETQFWNRVNQVLTDAGNLGIAVEVTLFDPWGGLAGGTNPTSPWNPAKNVVGAPAPGCGTTAGFSAIQYLASFDNSTSTTGDTAPANVCARGLQMAFIQHAAQVLNAHTNFYWNIANEVDLVPAGFTAPNPTAQLHWINWVAGVIAGVEGTASYPVRHPMGINLTNQTTISLANASNPALDSHIGIVNGHYVAFAGSGSVAALPLVKNNFNATPRPFAFGFTEGRSTDCPTLVGARAEAWEFLCGEGAIYDNYNLGRSDTDTGTIQTWLGNLKSFLAPFNLLAFNGPQTGSTPAWAIGLPAYGSADGTGTNFYWSASQATRSQYALYMHHSTIPMPTGINAFRYAPPAPSCHTFQTSMSLSLGSTAQHFKAEWVLPSSGAVLCAQDVNWIPGTPIPVTSPTYNYDLALRVLACSPGSTACAPVQSCSGAGMGDCPPPDMDTCPSAPAPACPTRGNSASCPNGMPACDPGK